MRYFVCAILLCGSFGAVSGDDKPAEGKDKERIAELKKQIEEKRKELIKLEADLEKLDPPQVVEVGAFKWTEMAIGQVGRFEEGRNTILSFRVERVLDGYVLGTPFERNPTAPRYLVKCDTKGIVDGKLFEAGERYRVRGTAKVGSQTLFVLEPWNKPAPKVEKK